MIIMTFQYSYKELKITYSAPLDLQLMVYYLMYDKSCDLLSLTRFKVWNILKLGPPGNGRAEQVSLLEAWNLDTDRKSVV